MVYDIIRYIRTSETFPQFVRFVVPVGTVNK